MVLSMRNIEQNYERVSNSSFYKEAETPFITLLPKY